MNKGLIKIICSAIIALGIVLSGFIIKDGLDNKGYDIKGLMTLNELSDYTGISAARINGIMDDEKDVGSRNGSGETNTFFQLPYLSIDGIPYFNKDAIDKWILVNSSLRNNY